MVNIGFQRVETLLVSQKNIFVPTGSVLSSLSGVYRDTYVCWSSLVNFITYRGSWGTTDDFTLVCCHLVCLQLS